jgi:acyl-CoA thioesterase-1
MIVAMGDSITYGQHLDPSKAWPKLLDSGHGAVYAAGVPGDTTRLGLERFPTDVQSLEPDIVVIQFGHNDANRWDTDRGLPRVSLAAYKANLVEMVERCRTFGAKPFLCSITPTTRSTQHIEDCRVYDRMLRRVADEEVVPLIDTWAAFQEFNLAVGAPLLLDDGLHLSEIGHMVYADTVASALLQAAIG